MPLHTALSLTVDSVSGLQKQFAAERGLHAQIASPKLHSDSIKSDWIRSKQL